MTTNQIFKNMRVCNKFMSIAPLWHLLCRGVYIIFYFSFTALKKLSELCNFLCARHYFLLILAILIFSFRNPATDSIRYVVGEVSKVFCTQICFLFHVWLKVYYSINLILQLISQQKSSQSKGQKAHVDAVFLQQLRALWKIIVPGAFSPESGFMCLVAGSLVARSLCDLWMIHNGTLIEG